MTTEVERLLAAWDVLLYTLGGPPAEQPSAVGGTGSSMTPQVPVTVLSGFLGAGKTTLLCRLLAQASSNIVAIVNDIASINVDAALVRAANAETIELENGCACCVLGGNLRETLYEIGARDLPPDAIVIEASGIADPMGIAQTVANVDVVTLDGIVTIVDAQTSAQLASDAAAKGLFERQLAAAHLVILSKVSTPGEIDTVRRLQNEVGSLAPGRPVIVYDHLFAGEDSAVEVLLGAALRGARPALSPQPHAYEGFAVTTIECPWPVDEFSMREILDRLPTAVYRLKGWMCLETTGRADCVEVQAAGCRWRIRESEHAPPVCQLVVIGRAGDDAFDEFVLSVRRLTSTAEQA